MGILFILILFGADILCEVAGHLCFKRGMSRLPHEDGAPAWSLIRGALRSPLIWGGLAVQAAALLLWVNILARVRLSVAYPAASLVCVGVLLASHFVLKEQIPPRRWLGGLLVAAGVALVGMGAPS